MAPRAFTPMVEPSSSIGTPKQSPTHLTLRSSVSCRTGVFFVAGTAKDDAMNQYIAEVERQLAAHG